MSKEKEESLRALFSTWGLDTVRKELRQSANVSLVPPDVTAFAREWVLAEEARSNRKAQRVRDFAIVFVMALVGGAVAVFLMS